MTAASGAELVCQQNFYHQRPGQNPQVLGNGTFAFVRHLKSRDPSVVVEGVTVTTEWQAVPLPYGVRQAGTVILRNCEGQFYETLPGEEQLRETQERVLEVSFHDWDRPALEVMPGEQLAVNPSNGTVVKVRARSGTVLTTFMVVPK